VGTKQIDVYVDDLRHQLATLRMTDKNDPEIAIDRCACKVLAIRSMEKIREFLDQEVPDVIH